MNVLCKSRDLRALFFRDAREAKQALSMLCAKSATEQQESASEAQANVSIAVTQSQAEIPNKYKIQKKGDVKSYRKILTQTNKSTIRIMLLFNPAHSDKFCGRM